jgi:succinyl-CoA synthetase beta subunit
MNLHEYQAKQLFSDYGITISPGKPAFSIEEAEQNALSMGGNGWVVKAQVGGER